MEIFFIIALSLVFLLGSLYNLSNIKKIKVRVDIPLHIKLIMAFAVMVFLFIAYKTRNDFISYLASLLGSLLFISGQYCKGLSEEAIYAKFYLLPISNLLISGISFEKLERIRIEEKKDHLILRANLGTNRID